MEARVEYQPSRHEWYEGSWAEVVRTFGAEIGGGDESFTRVLVQPQNGRNLQGEHSLIDFVHPENAVYIFGPDDGHLQAAAYDTSVYIPQADGRTVLWSHQAAAIVLYDRLVKSNGAS
jgi:tRNA(Leu) C34 or U34 (ribose-2'-O)-methylase TrmL